MAGVPRICAYVRSWEAEASVFYAHVGLEPSSTHTDGSLQLHFHPPQIVNGHENPHILHDVPWRCLDAIENTIYSIPPLAGCAQKDH